MAGAVRYPALYQINTRVWLRRLGQELGRPATLADVPDATLDRLAAQGFDWIWLLSVWQTSVASRAVSLSFPGWQRDFRETLPDIDPEADIAGSGFAIEAYRVADALGGADALAGLRERLVARGLKLMLDFVPNHTGLDHPWLTSRPDFFVRGSEEDIARAPQNYLRTGSAGQEEIFAHGRDPYFDGWPDTLQLNYGNADLQEVRIAELQEIARHCDGVRCDMAMLILPDVYQRTWGIEMAPFWPRAVERVRDLHPGFVFMAEVYWDLEWTLQQQGFDWCYDKRLYDRLRDGHAALLRGHLGAPLSYQDRLARFLENHDEARAAAAFEAERHVAAAAVTYLSPGLRFFHDGQFEGRRVRISPHLSRGPDEPEQSSIAAFYQRLLTLLGRDLLRNGAWQALVPRPAWPANESWANFVAAAWDDHNASRLIIVVNFAAAQSQCRLRLPFGGLAGRRWLLSCPLRDESYERDGDELIGCGLYLDLAAWQVNAFFITPVAAPAVTTD